MDATYTYPKLRWPLDLRIETHEKQPILLLRCPIGISSQPLALNAAVSPVVASFDGASSFDAILAKFSERGLTPELLKELIGLLDQSLFLANARFFEAEQKIKDEFGELKVRQPFLAGLSYSADPDTLKNQVNQILSHSNGRLTENGSLLGLMAPHIDYDRGSNCYGITYAELNGREEELYLLFGTAHQFSKHMFHLTAKDFGSPLGALECDVEFVTSLAARYGVTRSFADQILHRREHSLELQVPFLKYFRQNVRIVPILVGSFHTMLESGRLPNEEEAYESFAGALTELVKAARAAKRKVSFISGVDMAHVGQAFGDNVPLSPVTMEQVAERDMQYLAAIQNQDKRSLYAHIYEDQDKRRICGFPSMYLTIDLCDRLGIKYRSVLLDYRQSVNYETDCAVTFSGMAFFE